MGLGFGSFFEHQPEEGVTLQELWKDTTLDKDIQTRTRALVKIAERLGDSGDTGGAISAAETASELFKQQDNTRQVAHGYFFIGEQYFSMNSFEEAKKYFGYAESEFESTLHAEGQGEALKMLGYCNVSLNSRDRAFDCWHKAVGLFEEVWEPASAGLVTMEIGKLHHSTGAFEVALASYDRAFNFFKDADDLLGSANYHLESSLTLASLGRHEAAATHLESALQIYEFTENEFLANLVKYRLGIVYGDFGNHSDGIRLLEESAAGNRRFKVHHAVARCDLAKAIILQQVGQVSEAKAILVSVRAVFEGLGEIGSLIEAETALARNLLLKGDSLAAEELLAKNLKQATEKADSATEVMLRQLLAELYSKRQQHSMALEIVEGLVGKIDGLGLEVQTHWFNAHAGALVGLGRLAEARPILEKAVALDQSESAPLAVARSYELLSLTLDYEQQGSLAYCAGAAVSYYLKGGNPEAAARLARNLEPAGPQRALALLREADGQLSFLNDFEGVQF